MVYLIVIIALSLIIRNFFYFDSKKKHGKDNSNSFKDVDEIQDADFEELN